MKYLLYIFIAFSLALTSIVFAQDGSASIMNRIGLDGSGELAKMISDPKVSIASKRNAVQRLGELSKDLPANKNIPSSKLYNPILGVLTPQKGVEGHHVLRQEACNVLSKFADMDGSQNIINPLGRVIQNSDEHKDVRVAAARSLSKFRSQSSVAAESLLIALDKEMKLGPNPNNVRVVSAVISSLGRLGAKKAFVPLMRVLQSGFPSSTKRQAQASLESLEWKK